jgi:two-component system CheB/CheR fusion protein
MDYSLMQNFQLLAEPQIPKHATSFPVIGLGASAGGLQALKEFFTHMPAENGMAFVVIMHLSPRYESHVAALLQATTAMPVTQVNANVSIEPNHVYVIPPTKNLKMNLGEIILTEPEPLHEGKQVAIDLFFRTLGETHKQHAVGIVLSGMGSDGTIGLKRIKERNGLAFAQDPADAEHDSMPRHAIMSGLVDFVLPVAEMPARLIDIWRNASCIKLPPPTEPPVVSEQDVDEAALRDICTLLHSHTGHDFTHYKRATVLRRIERRLQVNGLHALAPYRDFMRAHPTEAQALLKDLLISVTNFFRDSAAFDVLGREVVPLLFHEKTTADQVRVWVAGCATGEEAYSVAVLLFEYAERMTAAPAVQVFATDLDEAALAKARAGSYTETIEADVSPERLRRFFTKEPGGYRIKKHVRERVLFAAHNLLKDPPFSRLDAITCRNLLIYLNPEAQRHVFELFHFVLRPNGFLFLGSSESAEEAANLFTTVDKRERIYRAVSSNRARLPVASVASKLSPPTQNRAAAGTVAPHEVAFGKLHQNLLAQHAPPSVIINGAYDIVNLSDPAGHAGRFLYFADGEPSHNLLNVVRPELQIELRATLFQAAQTGESCAARRVLIERAGRDSYVNIMVRPVAADAIGAGAHNYFLVLFDEVGGLTVPDGGTSGNEQVMRLLEAELQRTREQHQATVEQYKTQTADLQSSNAELQALNEELRSATEELETSKEELQSVNEEIQTINGELKEKLDELAVANRDLHNLITATDLATIFVDRDLNIKFYTPRAQDLFSLIPADVGRSLSDITHKLDYPDLLQDVGRVRDDAHKMEHEVASREGRWYIAQLIPYREEDRTDGVILTLIDFTRRKHAENETRAAKEALERNALALMEANATLQAEVEERQRVENERGQLLRRIVFTQEDERRRIAREMHDQLGQQLTVLKLKLDALKEASGENAKVCVQIEALQAIAERLDADVGYLAWEMRPTALDDLGLAAALSSYVQNWAQHFGLPVQLHASGMDKERLTPEIETTLYRIAQEALNNIAKYAHATHVAVMLERRDGQVSLIVEDDGVGFDLHQMSDASWKGLGLIGMRERAALVGGTVEIESQPGEGVTVVVRIAAPLAPETGGTNE